MSYDCCFRDYNPFKTLVRTHTKEDEYVREMEYSQDVNGPMPYLIIHHNYGGQWHTYRNYSNEGLGGIPWHLSEDERGDLPDFSINAKYYPTLGICRYSSRNIEIKEDKVSELNDWVVNSESIKKLQLAAFLLVIFKMPRALNVFLPSLVITLNIASLSLKFTFLQTKPIYLCSIIYFIS